MFRSASHAVEVGSRFVREFQKLIKKWQNIFYFQYKCKDQLSIYRSANAYKDCGPSGWTEKADYVECIRAMAEVIQLPP